MAGPKGGVRTLHPIADRSAKLRVHLHKEEPAADERDWYGNVALHHAATVDPPDLERVRRLIAEYPDGAKIKNQFGLVKYSMVYI
jgi:hypothetical protein